MINIVHPDGFRTVIPQLEIRQLCTEAPTAEDPAGTIARLVILQELATGQVMQTVLHFRHPEALGTVHRAIDTWAERAEAAYLSINTMQDRPVAPKLVVTSDNPLPPDESAGPKLSIDLT